METTQEITPSVTAPDPSADYGSDLLPQHAKMLAASAITPEVAQARGYKSVTKKVALKDLGFSEKQLIVPTLLVPIWGVNGEIVLFHHRPDQPRIREGKPAKYEFPAGSQMAVDVHPHIKQQVRDPSLPLFIAEGVKKEDAAISKKLCCIALLGVWNWRGTNEFGGKTTLPDWEAIAFKNGNDHAREVFICYDSDAMLKPSVHQAMTRLSAFLGSRGAKVRFIYLPHGEGGQKTGLDDYLAKGKSVDDLLSLATSELRPLAQEEILTPPPSPYEMTPHGLLWHHITKEGPILRHLTNFEARIVGQLLEDDGAEQKLLLEMEARCNGRQKRFSLPAPTFTAMNWPIEHLGSSAIVYPGFGLKDQARTAIQLLSGNPPQKTVYTHIGWREISAGEWVYLHGGGAIGLKQPNESTVNGDSGLNPDEGAATGDDLANANNSVSVQLHGPLSKFILPEPPVGPDLARAVRASLDLWDLGPEEITVPLHAAIYRATLGGVDFSIHLAGPTGAFKSELAAVAQQHFGAELNARNLPGNWSSTENSLEALAFAAKDAVFVVDDYVPTGNIDADKLSSKADRVLRAQGNNSGRQRMRADGTLRPPRPPQGLIISTGEDVPTGNSLRARMLVLNVSKGAVIVERLTHCQSDAEAGMYAKAMSAFLAWLAPRYGEERDKLKQKVRAYREKVVSTSVHRRTPDITANLMAGLKLFLEFAVGVGSLTAYEAKEFGERGWLALTQAEGEQVQHQRASDPAFRFVELVGQAITSGRAHVAEHNGDHPQSPGAWGWRQNEVGTGELARTEWRPQGERIGYIHEAYGDLYLIPDVAYSVAKRLGQEGREGIQITPRTLWKRLQEGGFLESTEESRQTLTIRRKVEGKTQSVLHFKPRLFMEGEPAIPDITD